MTTRKNQTTVDAFESTLRTSYEWLRTFGDELGQTHAQLSYRCFRAALHAIRDRLPAGEAASLAAQLPILLRGVFYEGWHPTAAPHRVHRPQELYEAVGRELDGGLAASPSEVMRAAFATLNARMDPGEIRKARHLLPGELRGLWPEPRDERAQPSDTPRA